MVKGCGNDHPPDLRPEHNGHIFFREFLRTREVIDHVDLIVLMAENSCVTA